MDEAKIIRKILKEITLPADIKSVDLSFRDDSTGMPSVWINLHVAEDNKPTPEKIQRLRVVREAISEKIFEKELSHWPYVQLVAD